jgi:hypothetical protein
METGSRTQEVAQRYQFVDKLKTAIEDRGMPPITKEEVIKFTQEVCWKQNMSVLVFEDAKKILDSKQQELGIVPAQEKKVEAGIGANLLHVKRQTTPEPGKSIEGKNPDFASIMAGISPKDKEKMERAKNSVATESDHSILSKPIAIATGKQSSQLSLG